MRIYNIVVTVLLVLTVVFAFKSNKSFKSGMKRYKIVNDSLNSRYLKQVKVADSLSKIKNKTIVEYKVIYKYIKNAKKETDNVYDVVYDFNERQIDSTIRAHKHTFRN